MMRKIRQPDHLLATLEWLHPHLNLFPIQLTLYTLMYLGIHSLVSQQNCYKANPYHIIQFYYMSPVYELAAFSGFGTQKIKCPTLF